MDAVIRATAIYVFLMLIFRITGKRSLSEITAFDLILLLIISETTQQAMLGDDFSMTNAGLVIITLITLEVGMSILQHRFPKTKAILDDAPLILVADGKMFREHMHKERVSEDDILQSARENQGIYRMDQIKYAVLERTGVISIMPHDNHP